MKVYGYQGQSRLQTASSRSKFSYPHYNLAAERLSPNSIHTVVRRDGGWGGRVTNTNTIQKKTKATKDPRFFRKEGRWSPHTWLVCASYTWSLMHKSSSLVLTYSSLVDWTDFAAIVAVLFGHRTCTRIILDSVQSSQHPHPE